MNHKENPQTSTHKPIPCASLHSLHPGFGKQHLKGQGVIGWIPVAILVPILDPWVHGVKGILTYNLMYSNFFYGKCR